ncbi:MAG: carboxypeptidase regulatory-like domain-containing protein, partial [Pseudomonadota bacterium]
MIRTISSFLSCLCLCGAFLYGQETTGTIRGIVTDPARAVVRGARITATNQSTGAQREVRSGAEGGFVFPLLPVGSYEFTAESSGFRRYVRRGIQVSVAQQLELDISLTLGEVSETVLVEGSADEVNVTRGSVGQVVETTAIQQLPLNGRNFLQLATLQAGVVPRGAAVTESTPVLPGQQTFSVNGLRPQSNNFLLDGADNNDGVLGSAAAVPSPDALEEFRILTNAYSAEYGRGGGAVVNVLTRSGTNQLHGSAYDYLRNNTFDARNFFSPTVPTLIRNQFGGSLGGPLRKDRTFLFGSYEGLRQKQGTVASATVLSARERQGDFSQTSTKPRDPSTNAAFPDNLIPASRINPIARNVLALIPLPNAGPNTLISTANNVTNANQFLLRGDHVISSKNTLSARYFRQTGEIAKPFTFPPPVNIPGLPYEDEFGFQNAVVTDTHTFRGNLLNEARLNVGRTRTFNNHPTYRIDPATLGFTYPAANIPMILGSGLTAFGTSTSSDGLRRDTTFQFQDHVTWVKGRHTVKFGLDFYHNRFSLREDSGVNGSFNFTGGVSGSTSADLLLGLASRFSQASSGTPAYFRSNLIQPYIQDDFRVSRRLTLNLGLRYELNLPVSEVQNRLLAFRPGQRSQLVPTAPTGLLFQGDPGVDQIIRTDKNNWAPRFGFAWD